jgi:excisionase family DNA binding protein
MRAERIRMSRSYGLLTVCETAYLIGVSRSTMYSMMEQGEIPYLQIRRRRRIRVRDVKRIIERGIVQVKGA